MTHFFVRYIYYPILRRILSLKAYLSWRKGVKLCDKQQKAIGSPRFYLFYNSHVHEWLPLTYERRRDAVSYKALVSMGKLRGFRIHSVADMKKACFYYTASKWGASACHDDHRKDLRGHYLKKWTNYYLSISPHYQVVRHYLAK